METEQLWEDEYANDPLLALITWDEGVLAGKPRLVRKRISVRQILDRLGRGWDFERVMQAYDLTQEEVLAALLYAASKMGPEVVRDHETLPR